MNTDKKLVALLLILVVIVYSSRLPDKKDAKQLESKNHANIILLMGDAHGWEEVVYNGHPHIKTPVLDDIAGQDCSQSMFLHSKGCLGSITDPRRLRRLLQFTKN